MPLSRHWSAAFVVLLFFVFLIVPFGANAADSANAASAGVSRFHAARYPGPDALPLDTASQAGGFGGLFATGPVLQIAYCAETKGQVHPCFY